MTIRIELSSNTSDRRIYDRLVESLDDIISDEWKKDKNVNFNLTTEIVTEAREV